MFPARLGPSRGGPGLALGRRAGAGRGPRRCPPRRGRAAAARRRAATWRSRDRRSSTRSPSGRGARHTGTPAPNRNAEPTPNSHSPTALSSARCPAHTWAPPAFAARCRCRLHHCPASTGATRPAHTAANSAIAFHNAASSSVTGTARTRAVHHGRPGPPPRHGDARRTAPDLGERSRPGHLTPNTARGLCSAGRSVRMGHALDPGHPAGGAAHHPLDAPAGAGRGRGTAGEVRARRRRRGPRGARPGRVRVRGPGHRPARPARPVGQRRRGSASAGPSATSAAASPSPSVRRRSRCRPG